MKNQLCSSFGCDRRENDGARFPLSNAALCSIWLKRTKRDDLKPTKNSYICGAHFLEQDWELVDGKKCLKEGTVPQPADAKGYSVESAKRRESAEARRSRAANRRAPQHQQQQCVVDQPVAHDDETFEINAMTEESSPTTRDINHDPIKFNNYDVKVTIDIKTGVVSYCGDCSEPVLPRKIFEEEITTVKWIPEHLQPETHQRWKEEEQLRLLRDRVECLEKELALANTLKTNLKQVYSSTQMKVLESQDGNVLRVHWQDEDILKGIRLKFNFGSSGYEAYLNEGHPSPSLRTLQRRTENFKCLPGLDPAVFEILRQRLLHEEQSNKSFCLVNDEMSLTAGKQYDPATKTSVGDSTLPLHSGLGTKGMTWMVAGVKKRIKQPVMWHLTPNAVHGSAIRLVNEELIKALEEKTGAVIIAYATDMSACNLHLWRDYGIDGTRDGKVTFEVDHPADDKRKLVILPDSPHLAKNMKASLTNNEIFILSDEIVQKHQLKTNKVLYSHVLQAELYERNDELKLAPKLAKADLKPNTFQKMRVNNSVWVFNDSTAAALEFLAEEKKDCSYLTTAWFIRQFHMWFKKMVAYSRAHALSMKDMEKYKEDCDQLKGFMDIVRGIFVKGGWKPWQRGVLVATTGYLALADRLLSSGELEFILGSRFSTNCVENLYAVAREKNKVPNCLQFRNTMKAIILTQYAKAVKSSSYDNDLTDLFASDGFGTLSSLKVQLQDSNNNTSEPPKQGWSEGLTPKLSLKTRNSLFYVAGYLADSITAAQVTCWKCWQDIVGDPYHAEYTSFTESKQFSEGLLTFVTPLAFTWFETAEQLFQAALAELPIIPPAPQLQEILQAEGLQAPIATCHDVFSKILRRFVTFRLKVHCGFVSNQTKKKHQAPASKGSSTAGGHAYTTNPSSAKKRSTRSRPSSSQPAQKKRKQQPKEKSAQSGIKDPDVRPAPRRNPQRSTRSNKK